MAMLCNCYQFVFALVTSRDSGAVQKLKSQKRFWLYLTDHGLVKRLATSGKLDLNKILKGLRYTVGKAFIAIVTPDAICIVLVCRGRYLCGLETLTCFKLGL